MVSQLNQLDEERKATKYLEKFDLGNKSRKRRKMICPSFHPGVHRLHRCLPNGGEDQLLLLVVVTAEVVVVFEAFPVPVASAWPSSPPQSPTGRHLQWGDPPG